MASTFSDKSWSGTPMWQIAEELEEARKKRDAEERRKASTPVCVLNIRFEGESYLADLALLIPSKAAESAEFSGFREAKLRGPRRKSRAEAIMDGFELRRSFHKGGEAELMKRRGELQDKVWAKRELPHPDAPVEEPGDREQRLRLAQRPSGTGWSRQKDAEFFVHTHSPMAYDPKKMQYFEIDSATNRYVPCHPPHDPVDYPIRISAGSSLVGQSEKDNLSPDRPRSLLLKELVLTGRAMKKPLFFLDQPASCFVLFEGLRGSAAVDHCSKNFHTKLLAKLSASLQYWSDGMVQALLKSIIEELDQELLHQAATCYDGASVTVVLLLGDRLHLATLGTGRALLLAPESGLRVLGDKHRVAEEGAERQRLDKACAEVVSGGRGAAAGKLAVRRPLLERQTAVAQEQEAEIRRVLECAPDSFATLGFSSAGEEEKVDSKAAKVQYRKLALKVHPDKAPEGLQLRAKEAFAKVEEAVARVEKMCEACEPEAVATLQKILEHAGSVGAAVMPRSWARAVLQVEESATTEEVEQRCEELKKKLLKLGQFADGRPAHPDTERAARLLEDAVETLAAPTLKEGREPLEAVGVSRALGLRDLKRPRPIILAEPQIDTLHLDGAGTYHLAILSDAAARALGDEEAVARVKSFPRQPKVASLLLSHDASQAGACLASSIVVTLQVGEEKVEEPPAKKAKADRTQAQQGDKVRCLHILLKHKELKLQKDPQSMLRMKGKGAVTRSVAQAEKELLEMQRSLQAKPNTFHVLARKHSECDTAMQPGQNAGDLGWVNRGCCPDPQLEDVMFNLRMYEVSDIITTVRGLHILQRIA